MWTVISFFMKNKSICPVCFYEGELSSFVHRKNMGVYEKLVFKCPSCRKKLILKFFYIYVSMGVLVLFLILGLFFLKVSVGAASVLFSIIFFCIFLLKKKGYIGCLDKVVFVQKNNL